LHRTAGIRGQRRRGWAPLGYDVKERKLIINETEAAVVRRIFERFAKCGSATTIVRELAAEVFVNRYGQRLDKGRIYKLLNNRVYIGEAVHKGIAYPGEHEAIVGKDLWDRSACRPWREPASPSRQVPGTDAGIAEGPHLRTDRPGHVADPHPEGSEALPLLVSASRR
jgi:hypothetical protein